MAIVSLLNVILAVFPGSVVKSRQVCQRGMNADAVRSWTRPLPLRPLRKRRAGLKKGKRIASAGTQIMRNMKY